MTQLEPVAQEEIPAAAGSEDATRELVARLARSHRSGGSVIERAAILAEGADASRVVAWVIAHGGQPEAAAAAVQRGLHGARGDGPAAAARPPARYVLPPGALA
jgi:hypothetical protein